MKISHGAHQEVIRFVRPEDASSLCGIYNHYIENSIITFEVEAVTTQMMRDRIGLACEKHPWLVYEVGKKIVGYAYASSWKSRCAYRFSVETTVYLAADQTGKGIGTRLYKELIEVLKKTSCHSLIAGIALPNDASIALHENLKFEKIGHFKEVGWKFDKWIDVGYWESLL